MLLKNLTMAARRTSALTRHLSTTENVSTILTESVGHARVMSLNRTKALNALSLEMVRAMKPTIESWSSNDEVSLVLLKGEGGKAFCAGGDVVTLARNLKEDGLIAKDFFREEYVVDNLLATLPKTFVALIDGIVMGGGVGISLPANFRVATEKTMFAMPETGIGLFPDVGGSFHLPRLEGKLGLFLGLTGHRLMGADNVHAGIATHCVKSEDLAEVEEKLLAVADAADVNGAVEEVLTKYNDIEGHEFSLAPHMDLIDSCFAGDTVEDIIENLETSGDEFAVKQAQKMKKMSPTSMKITHKQLQLGANLSLEECFGMEYRMTQAAMGGHDFYEGVRALLIDQDKNPQWSPSTLADVTEELVNRHFKPVENDLFITNDKKFV
eukprot:m.9824 g.9824  ORF g.9824 m.9824 type:complete len:382 (-) comp4141_c0_seq1:26-1171(-)